MCKVLISSVSFECGVYASELQLPEYPYDGAGNVLSTKICGQLWTRSWGSRRATPGTNVMMPLLTYGCEPLTRLLP